MKSKLVPFIGVDASLTNSGICIIQGDQYKLFQVPTKSGEFQCAEQRVRYIALEIKNKIESWLDKDLSDVVCGIEDYAFNARVGRAFALGEVGGFVKQVMWSRTGRVPLKVNIKTLKVFITGRGNVGKAHHLLYAFDKWGIKFPNDDVCDAYAIAKLMQSVFADPGSLFKYEQTCCKNTMAYADNDAILKESKLFERILLGR